MKRISQASLDNVRLGTPLFVSHDQAFWHLAAALTYHTAAWVVFRGDAHTLDAETLLGDVLQNGRETDQVICAMVDNAVAFSMADQALRSFVNPMQEAHRAGRLTEKEVMAEDWSGLDI